MEDAPSGERMGTGDALLFPAHAAIADAVVSIEANPDRSSQSKRLSHDWLGNAIPPCFPVMGWRC